MQRYDPIGSDGEYYPDLMDPRDEGEYVLAAEAQAEIDALHAECDRLTAMLGKPKVLAEAEECNRVFRGRLRKAERLLGEWHECSDIPERNCSCHINPPCGDCVAWGGIREVDEETKRFLEDGA